MSRYKLLLVAAGSAVLLGACVTAASARQLSTSSQTLRATFASVEFGGGFGTVRCPVTLEGSLHARTLPKRLGLLLGYLTRAALGACATGAATLLTETLPWHLRYAGFTGTLPNFTAMLVRVIDASFQVEEPVFRITCLATSSEVEPITWSLAREGGGALTVAEASGEIGTDCGIRGTLRARSASLTVLNNAARITLTLI